MAHSLPIEVVDLVLDFSLHKNSHLLANIAQAATLCRLSKHHRIRYTKILYRHVVLLHQRAKLAFRATVTQQPELGALVSTLVVLPDPSSLEEPTADRILSACPNAIHLLLSRQCFFDWSPGLYRLVCPREVTLVGVLRASDLDGLATRHRELMTRVLENDPHIQSALRASATPDEDVSLPPTTSLSFSSPPRLPAPFMLQSSPKSLTHLHLLNFDGHLLHHLATLSSLTHVVLTNPTAPPRDPATPTLALIPRATLLLLLATGNIAKLVIRADIASCLTIMEQVMPINDAKLVFRPSRTPKDPLFDRSPGSGPSVSHIREVEIMSEFMDRVKVDTHRVGREWSSPGSSSDTGTSHGSSGSASRSSNNSEEDERSSHHDDDYFDDEDDNHQRADTRQQGFSSDAPPPRIPIEELLRQENFQGRGYASNTRTQPDSSVHTSEGLSNSSDTRRKLRAKRGPFVAQRHDLRGATQANVDQLSLLYDTLAADAGVEQEMQFW